ncbi:MAG: hypothetical protein ACR2HM_03300 [Acidimicrobiales bacterium]
MPNPEQPELGPDVGADRGPVPPENQPGHHPDEDQDKPDLDRFAAKLGTMEPDEREAVLEDERPTPAPAARRGALVGVAALVALVLAVLAGRRIRGRRSR